MSKIIQAINAMISNANLITEVTYGDEVQELFFLYKNQYKWSILRSNDASYSLWFYKTSLTIHELSNLHDSDWENVTMVKYSTKELATREAFSSFEELHRIVSEKVLGMDAVLDDIIKDMDDLPF